MRLAIHCLLQQSRCETIGRPAADRAYSERAEQSRTVVLVLMLMLAPNYVYIYTQQKLTVSPDLDQTPHQQGPNGRRNHRRQALNEPIR